MMKQLDEWALKVRIQKKELDLRMFDDMMRITRDKLNREGYDKTREWLKNNALIVDNRVGPILLAQNGKLIMDKLWSLKQNGYSLGSGKAAGNTLVLAQVPVGRLGKPVAPESPKVKT